MAGVKTLTNLGGSHVTVDDLIGVESRQIDFVGRYIIRLVYTIPNGVPIEINPPIPSFKSPIRNWDECDLHMDSEHFADLFRTIGIEGGPKMFYYIHRNRVNGNGSEIAAVIKRTKLKFLVYYPSPRRADILGTAFCIKNISPISALPISAFGVTLNDISNFIKTYGGYPSEHTDYFGKIVTVYMSWAENVWAQILY